MDILLIILFFSLIYKCFSDIKKEWCKKVSYDIVTVRAIYITFRVMIILFMVFLSGVTFSAIIRG